MKIGERYLLKRNGTQPYIWEYIGSVRRIIKSGEYIDTMYMGANVFRSEDSKECKLNLSDRSVYKEASFQHLVIGAAYVLERRAGPTSCYFDKDIEQLDLLEVKYVSSFTFEHNGVQSEIDTPEFWRLYTKVSPEQEDYTNTFILVYNQAERDRAIEFYKNNGHDTSDMEPNSVFPRYIAVHESYKNMSHGSIYILNEHTKGYEDITHVIHNCNGIYIDEAVKLTDQEKANTLLSSYIPTNMNTLQQEVFASYLKKHSKDIIKTTEAITEELEAIQADIKAMEEFECTLGRIKTKLEKAYNNQDKKTLEEAMAEANDFLSDDVPTDA